MKFKSFLSSSGKQLSDDRLPTPAGLDAATLENRLLQAELDCDAPLERILAEDMRSQMYPEQAYAFDAITTAVSNEAPFLAFVDGPGGSGKTFLYEAVLHHVRGAGLIGLACDWSGIAAVFLQRGRTVHARFGLPVPLPREAVPSSVTAQSIRAEVLRRARIVVWDEAPMAPKEALEAVDVLLRDLMQLPDVPFGGKVFVLGGDFRQVLPVMSPCKS